MLASRVCRDPAFHEELPNGLTICRLQPDDISIRREDWAFTYLAAPGVYKTPLGDRFIANCGPGLFTTSIGWCTVAYLLEPGVGITYRFDPYNGPKAISADQLIDFDKGLRTQFEDAKVKNFAWPEQGDSNKATQPKE